MRSSKLLCSLTVFGVIAFLIPLQASILITDFTSAGTNFVVEDDAPATFATQQPGGVQINGSDSAGTYFWGTFNPVNLSSLGDPSSMILSLTASSLTSTAASTLNLSLYSDSSFANYYTWQGTWPSTAGVGQTSWTYLGATGSPTLNTIMGANFELGGTGAGNLNFTLTNLSAIAVPEPSSFLTLAALGFAGLLRRRVRRRTTALG